MQEVVSLISLKNNPLSKDKLLNYPIKKSVISILFSSQKAISFEMGPGRSMQLAPYSSYLFYEQNKDFVIPIFAQEPCHLISLEIPIKALHSLLTKGVDELNFSNAEVFQKERYHKLSENSERIRRCIEEIESIANPLMLEAKKFELLSYYFSTQDVQTYDCPFLNQKENVTKVRNAKEILIRDLQQSPTIKELSKEVGLNEYNLKTGFKEIYSKPIHTFLKDHKMNTAREMIDSKQFKVNEIAEKVGYSNVSHFIEAFKRKFGKTPKQYELSTK